MKSSLKHDIVTLCTELQIDIPDIFDIFNAFFMEFDNTLFTLRYLNQKNDWGKFKKQLHNLKGTTINLNLIDMHELTVNLYTLIDKKKYGDINFYLSKLENLASKTKFEIQDFFIHYKIEV